MQLKKPMVYGVITLKVKTNKLILFEETVYVTVVQGKELKALW